MQDIIFNASLIGCVLNNEVYGNRAAITKLPADEMGPAMFMLANAVAGQQVTFVDDFSELDDITRLIKRLEAGEDVTLELAYNKVQLPEGLDDARASYKVATLAAEAAAERRTEAKKQLDELLGTVRQEVTALREERRRERFRNGVLTPEQEKTLKNWVFGTSSIRNPSHYRVGVKTGKKVWDAALPLWEKTPAEVPSSSRNPRLGQVSGVRSADYNRTAEIFADRVVIGCQTIERWIVEAMARHYG